MRCGRIVRGNFALINPVHVSHVVFCVVASDAVHHAAHPERCADESNEEEHGKNALGKAHVRKVGAQALLRKSAALAPRSPIR